ncbi:4'-phosphopantetheinyl transferase superfamily protein [Amycolatopsis sp. YIM 10]|uniref:4'-phosphopantetheinyl transferase family protein n=1 Tax=Amycolatopsis sp. YIM 10 TaxID=2653857 RepID=UPI00128FF62D|nr:4'-phosphopantetheinyl transferase superfamily protein [Amycolatopsis sp. YIM 10]QFU86029.1 4'-phosphopantetheinyl transferase sfp [Amycolatopsis sp. YIM 10]
MIDCTVWWAAPLPATADRLALLAPEEVDRYQAYRKDEDKLRFLTGRVLAKTVSGERLGRSPGSIELDATCEDCGKPHGPPRVPGAEFRFSISHSGDWIGLAIADAPLGLDVETATRRADDSLIEYALNDDERAALNGLTPDQRAEAFFTYWTRKEALMKATGRGLKIPLQALTLSPFGEPARLVHSGDAALTPEGTRMADLNPGTGYRAAVAILTTDEIKVTESVWPA